MTDTFHRRELLADFALLAERMGELPVDASPSQLLSCAVDAKIQLNHDLEHACQLAEPPADAGVASSVEGTTSAVRVALQHLRQLVVEMQPSFESAASTKVVSAVARLSAMADAIALAAEALATPDTADEPLMRSHRAARVLLMCPKCGASLGREDRTFAGTLCEACGTSWVAGELEI